MLSLTEPMSRPEIASTVPSASTVPVGYQRPPDIGALFVNVSVDGLNDDVFFSPIQGGGGSYLIVPPRTNGWPSGSTTMPLQNMSHRMRNERSVRLTGSKTAASPFGVGSRLPEPAMTSTLLLCISATWTGLMDISTGSVVHWPVRYGAAAGARSVSAPCRCSAGSMNGCWGGCCWATTAETSNETTSARTPIRISILHLEDGCGGQG